MENVLTYLLQVNLLLVIVFLGYQFLLKNLTFYKLNRVYFVIGTLYALVYPFIDIKSWFQQKIQGELPAMWEYVEFSTATSPSVASFRLYDLFIFLIGVGLFVFLLKLIIQLTSMLRIHFYSKPSQWRDYLYRNVLFPVAPFSFFNKIYVHKEQHREMELEDIFEHEYIHVKGRHTIDILLFEIVLIGCWYNPFVWLMRKAVRQNLEFLTDQQVLNKGVDRQTYQYSLLNVTKQGAAVGLGNQFNFKTLKKRIMMMNKKRSSRLELSKYAFLLPIVILTGASFTVSQVEGKIEEVVVKTQETKLIDESLSVKMKGEVGQLLKETLGTDIIQMDTSESLKGEVTGIKIGKQNNPDSVAYVLDGKLVSIDELKKLDAKELESVVLNFENEISRKYNKKSVLNIETKKYAGTEGTPSKFKEISFNGNKLEIKGPLRGVGGKNAAPLDFNTSEVTFSDDTVNRSNNKISDPEVISVLEKSSFSNTKPLFVVDGKPVPADFEMKSIKANDIESITILKDKSATALYGEKAKDGVILITTKQNTSQKDNLIKSVISKEIETLEDKKSEGTRGVIFNDYGHVTYTIKSENTDKAGSEANFGTSKVIRLGSKVDADELKKILFIIDGKESSKEVMNSLNPNDIENITVLKDKSATAIYGEKAKDGVILIDLKKEKTNKEVVVVGYKKRGDSKDVEEVTITEKEKGQKSSAASEVVVVGYKKDGDSNSVEEVSITAKGKKSSAAGEVVVVGYKKGRASNSVEEVTNTAKGKGQKSSNTKETVVTGYKK